MRKYSASLSVLCIVLIALTPFPLSNQDGVYNTYSGLYWCTSPASCLHEQGHKLDQELGWISHSKEFGDAVKIYILSESKKDKPGEFLYKIFATPDFTMPEIYAQIYSWSGGNPDNMPKVFRTFYRENGR